MASQSISGLGSGLDISTIVSQLSALQRNPIIRLNSDIKLVDTRKQGIQEVSNLLSSLRSAAVGLRDESLWAPTQPVTASDEKIAKATRTNTAAPGGYQVQVLAMARSEQQVGGTGFTTASANDTLSIKVGSGAAVNVDIAAGDDLKTIAAKINGNAGVGAYAAVINEKLYLTGKQTGASNTVSLTSTGTTAATLGMSVSQAGADASYKVDSGPVLTSSSNSVSNAIPGVDLAFTGVGTTSFTVGDQKADADKIASKMEALVKAYNDVLRGSNERVTKQPIKNPATEAEKLVGALFGNDTLRGVINDVRQWKYRTVQGAPAGMDGLEDLGITIQASASADANQGLLNFDKSKFMEQYNSDPAAARKLLDNFTGDRNTEGFSQWIEKQVDGMLNTGGIVAAGLAGQDSRREVLTDRQERLEYRATKYEERIKRQFSKMDTLVGTINGQASWVSGQLSALANG